MKKIKRLIIIALTLFLLFGSVNMTEAASLGYDRSSVNPNKDETFDISVKVNPTADSVTATDVYITYNSDVLSVQTIKPGNMFPTVSNDTSVAGKIYIAGMVNDPATAISSEGVLATITFKAVKEGSSTLSFDCSSSTVVKNDADATNVLNCSSNGSVTVTVGSSSGGSQPAPTTPPSAPVEPQTLPKSGVFENVVKIAVPGSILLLVGSVLRMVL